MSIDWSKQHCGVHQATAGEVFRLMPDLTSLLAHTFPRSVDDYMGRKSPHANAEPISVYS